MAEEMLTEYHDEEYDLPSEPSEARPVAPVTFFGPTSDPGQEMDLRPAAITLTEKELDQVREDGQGNFRSTESVSVPVHPSTAREKQPYQKTNVADDEETEENTDE